MQSRWLLALVLVACTAHVDDPKAGAAFSPSAATRLSRVEYDRTVRDLLFLDADQLTVRPSDGFPEDEILDREVLPFSLSLHASDLHVSAETVAAERLAQLALAHPERLLTCSPGSAAEETACATDFVARFAPRAYRRAVSDAEKGELLTLYTGEREAGGTFLEGVGAIIQGALVSPHFLFHVPLPARSTRGDIQTLGDEEMASRLSYFVWGSMPDDALFAAAQAHQLGSDQEIEAQVRRMLADPRARDSVHTFFDELYQVDHIDGIFRDQTLYPEMTPELARSLEASVLAFLDDAFWGQDTFAALFRGSRVFADGPMSQLYGLPTVNGSTLTPVDGDPQRFSGLLTQPGIMALIARVDGSDPVHRGLFVRRRLLCLTIPPPPMDLMNNVPSPSQEPALTTRQRYAQHSADPSCAGCHSLIDNVGFPLEHFDGIGRWRDMENGQPIDATGAVVGLPSGDLLVDGAADMMQKLEGTQVVQQCFTRQLYYYANKKAPDEADAAELDRLTARFVASGGSFSDLMVAMALSPAFRTRTANGSSL